MLRAWIEKLQSLMPLESYSFLGISLDRFGHFFIPFFMILIFDRFDRLKPGIWISGFLVLLKEVMDLYVVWTYNDLRRVFILDSTIDFSIGIFAMTLAFGLAWYRRSSKRQDSRAGLG